LHRAAGRRGSEFNVVRRGPVNGVVKPHLHTFYKPHIIMKTILWIALLGISSCICSGAALAQTPASGQRAEMKKLDWLVGQWQGTGWMQMGPQVRKEFTITETIEGKLDGLVLVIEGHGKSKEDGRAVHTALAFVSYDEGGKTFRWRAFTAEGRQTDTAAKVGANTLEWGLEILQRGRMRSTTQTECERASGLRWER
jgi:hypothetical protein